MDDLTKEQIAGEAQQIRRDIKGGMLYGWPVDMDNIDMLLVAAWCAGRQYENNYHQEQLKQADEVLSRFR